MLRRPDLGVAAAEVDRAARRLRAAAAATRASSEVKYCSGRPTRSALGARASADAKPIQEGCVTRSALARALRGSRASCSRSSGRYLCATQLDGQPKDDVLVDRRERADVAHATSAEPVAHARDEPLRRRRARGQPDRLDVRRASARRSPSRRRSGARPTPAARATSTEAVRVRRVARADRRAAGRSGSSISLTAHWRFEVA